MSNKYKKEVKGVFIDVYDVLAMYDVKNPAIQHAVKKLLMPGERGAKDLVQDLEEAKQSIERALEMENLELYYNNKNN